MRTIKTLLADDQPIFIEGLKNILQKASACRFDISGVACSGVELLRLSKKKTPDLIVLELNLPQKDGLDVIRQLRLEKSKVRIIALSSYGESKLVKTAFKFGVNGYILKNGDIDELFTAIQEVLNGNNFVGTGLLSGEAEGAKPAHARLSNRSFFIEDRFVKKHHLTKREVEILQLITQALSNKEIAKELFISDQTVGVHRKNIMRKLGVSNTAGLLKMAYDYSLI